MNWRVARVVWYDLKCPRSSVDRVLASGARDRSSNLRGGTCSTDPGRRLLQDVAARRRITRHRRGVGVWPSGKAPALGAGDRQFESAHPDQPSRCILFPLPDFPSALLLHDATYTGQSCSVHPISQNACS